MSEPPTLPPRWFYDETGSLLFEAITRLQEYYPARAEAAILSERAPEIAAHCRASVLLELGSGTSEKTRRLLDALGADGTKLSFVPLDISQEVLLSSAAAIAADYPHVTVQPLVADMDEALPSLPGRPGDRLIAFLGSTIGNYPPGPRAVLLRRLAAALDPGDHLLLGADLVKDPVRLVRAYDDARGVTAAFNLNLLQVLNRELDADLDSHDFEHVAAWNANCERIEMWLRARRDVSVRFGAIDWTWQLPAGGGILTETSAKFRIPSLHQELVTTGWSPVETWCDSDGDYSLTLVRRCAGT